MREERERRYAQKLELIRERMGNVISWTSGYSVEEFSSDTKTRLATFKALQEIVEASMDVCAMMLRDMGSSATDDYSNIDKLARKGVLSEEIAGFLRRANGLRNRLVHEYNAIADELVLKFIRSDLGMFERFSEVVREWLRRR